MFEQVLAAERRKPSARRMVGAGVSIAAHVGAVAVLVWVSLMRPPNKPTPEVTVTFFAGLPAPPPPPPPPPAAPTQKTRVPKEPKSQVPTTLVQPQEQDKSPDVRPPEPESAEPEPGGVEGGVEGGVQGGVEGGVVGGVLGGTGSGHEPPPPPEEKPIVLPPTELARQRDRTVDPIWPAAAKAAGITGSVKLYVCTDAEGAVKDVSVVRNNPVFDQAAISAVRQWKYRPYFVDGRPTPICGLVTIEFSFQ